MDAKLSEPFNQDDLLTLQKLEETLLSGEIDAAVIEKYPELNRESLSVQLSMFRLNYSFSNRQCRGCRDHSWIACRGT